MLIEDRNDDFGETYQQLAMMLLWMSKTLNSELVQHMDFEVLKDK